MRQSSAKRRGSECLAAPGRSLIKARNSKGPRLYPAVHQKQCPLVKNSSHPRAPVVFFDSGRIEPIRVYDL